MAENQTNEHDDKQLSTIPDNSETIFAKKLEEYLLTKGGGSSPFFVVGKITPTGVTVHQGANREEAAQILEELPSNKRKEELETWKQKRSATGKAIGEAVSTVIKTTIKTLKGDVSGN